MDIRSTLQTITARIQNGGSLGLTVGQKNALLDGIDTAELFKPKVEGVDYPANPEPKAGGNLPCALVNEVQDIRIESDPRGRPWFEVSFGDGIDSAKECWFRVFDKENGSWLDWQSADTFRLKVQSGAFGTLDIGSAPKRKARP
jgi:hypothetical protein